MGVCRLAGSGPNYHHVDLLWICCVNSKLQRYWTLGLLVNSVYLATVYEYRNSCQRELGTLRDSLSFDFFRANYTKPSQSTGHRKIPWRLQTAKNSGDKDLDETDRRRANVSLILYLRVGKYPVSTSLTRLFLFPTVADSIH